MDMKLVIDWLIATSSARTCFIVVNAGPIILQVLGVSLKYVQQIKYISHNKM